MKKINLFSIFGLLMACVFAFTFTSCSSDDDDDVSESDIKSSIVGVWESTHISGYTYDDTEDENITKVDMDIPTEDRIRMQFSANGTYKEYFYLKSYGEWYGGSSRRYEVSGNKLYLYDSKDNIEYTYTITSLKGNTVVIEYHLEEGAEYKGHLTLTKVE